MGSATSGGLNSNPLFTGTGMLQVTTGPGPGDFNRDGSVDAADLVTWTDGYGTDFDGADFLTWQREIDGASATAASAPVPEPSAMLLTTFAASAILACRRGRRPLPTS